MAVGQTSFIVEYDLPPKDHSNADRFYRQAKQLLGEGISKRTSTTSVLPVDNLELARQIKALVINCNGKCRIWRATLIE